MNQTLNWLLAIPVVVPFIGAATTLLLSKRQKAQSIVAIGALTLVLVDAFAIAALTHQGPMVLDVGGWSAPVGISLVGDRLSATMLLVSVFVTLCVLIYASVQDSVPEQQSIPVTVFYPTFLILSAGVSNAFLTGDLFNLYVGFEILLVASFVLITLGGTRDRIRSGTIYIVVSLVSSTLFLVAIAMTYAATGTVNLAQLAIRMPEIDPGTAQLIEVMMLIAFGVKAAVFPLSSWLPDSYPTAPAPVTAVFAGLLTKVGVYSMIRTETLLFPDSKLRNVLLVVAILSMLIGILGATAQDDIKRLLSFTLVSHIGFMVWGLAVGTPMALQATIFYTAHHIIVQTALFLVAGLMEIVGGSTSLRHLGSLLRTWPLLAFLYMIPALNLSGIPPFSGFLGKLGLVSASVDSGTTLDWVTIAAAMVCSLLTLYVMMKAWNMSFWQSSQTPVPRRKVPKTMTFATMALVIASVSLTVFARPIVDYTQNAAENLLARDPYISAVLPDYERGTGISDSVVEEDEGSAADALPMPSSTPLVEEGP